jgi:hypothetical protein
MNCQNFPPSQFLDSGTICGPFGVDLALKLKYFRAGLFKCSPRRWRRSVCGKKLQSPTSVLASAAEGPCAPRVSCRWLVLMALVRRHHHHRRDRRPLDAPPCSSPTSLVLSPMPRGKVFFRILPIQAIPYFKRPAALLRPPDSLFLSCLNSSSFKTSSLSLQNLKPQAFKSQAPKSSSTKSLKVSRCAQSPYSRFAIHFFRHRKISTPSHHVDIRPLLAALGSRAPSDRLSLLSCGHYKSGQVLGVSVFLSLLLVY